MGFVNYKNGNYVVYINTETGDKIRNTKDAEFLPAFAENCDVTISDRCDGHCGFCYAGCTENGKHGDLNAKCLDTVHSYTELAINGNDLSHPDLESFLIRMKDREVFVNMTLNQIHFERHYDYVLSLQDRKLIHGVGVSVTKPTDELIDKIKQTKNAVVHVINDIITEDVARKMMGHDLDILILGYKHTNRGRTYIDGRILEMLQNRLWLYKHMDEIFDGFKSVSFDNLAIKQLQIKDKVPKEVWDKHYMGDDGKFTFFINLVDGYFAKNSTDQKHYPLMDSVEEMYQYIQEKEENDERKEKSNNSISR